MIPQKFVGRISLVLLIIAILILAILVLFVFSPSLATLLALNPQALIVVSGVLALVATNIGFYAYKTSPGKIGAIGGLVLFIAIACLLSFTTIAYIREIDA